MGTYKWRTFHEKRITIVTSTNNNINTRSSTASDIIGVHEFMPDIFWTRYFMEAKVYQSTKEIVHPDNKSVIILENNRKSSSIKRTKHI